MNTHPTRGRPALPDDQKASSHIHLRSTAKRKAAYVRAAQKNKQTLADWSFEHLDAASGFEVLPPAAN
jgi:hypothetical protein